MVGLGYATDWAVCATSGLMALNDELLAQAEDGRLILVIGPPGFDDLLFPDGEGKLQAAMASNGPRRRELKVPDGMAKRPAAKWGRGYHLDTTLAN